ncbi:MAG: hypothetical protein EXQ94_00920 [Alphaproteobacteria bacterium]|nr:hypothetical protein [Alphaproteobacteria bacterium]
MKHAGDVALDQLDDLLARLRATETLRERKRGIFYRGGTATLHFHEDAAGLFADLKVGAAFERHPVTTAVERRAFLATFKRHIAREP